MLTAFNRGEGATFADGFAEPSFHPYAFRIVGSGFADRDSIVDFVAERHRAGDGWSAVELAPPTGGVGLDEEAIYGLALRVSQHGALVRRGGAKLVVDCRSGLLSAWVGPAYGPDDVHTQQTASKAKGSCPVTLPNGSAPDKDAGFNHGNGSLWAALWPDGKLVAGPLPDGSSWAEINPDGSIEAKLGWWRGIEGTLIIGGRRLDASAPPLQAHIPDGYGVTGFQATGISFPTEGCWEVTGKIQGASLTFVVSVLKR